MGVRVSSIFLSGWLGYKTKLLIVFTFWTLDIYLPINYLGTSECLQQFYNFISDLPFCFRCDHVSYCSVTEIRTIHFCGKNFSHVRHKTCDWQSFVGQKILRLKLQLHFINFSYQKKTHGTSEYRLYLGSWLSRLHDKLEWSFQILHFL